MENRERKLIDICKLYLLEYFSDGVRRQPSDMDEIIGGTDVYSLMIYGNARWDSTHFYIALGELVEERKINFRRKIGDKENWYWIRKAS